MSEKKQIASLGEIEFPAFDVPKKDLPKGYVLAVQLFQDGSIVYELDGQLIGEWPSLQESEKLGE